MTISSILKISNFIKLGLALLLSGIFFWLGQEVSETYDLQKNFYRVDALISEIRIISDSKTQLLLNAARMPEDGQLEVWEELQWREDGSRPRPDTSFLRDERLSLTEIAQEIDYLDDEERAMMDQCLILNDELTRKGHEALMLAHGLSADKDGRFTVFSEIKPQEALNFIHKNKLDKIPGEITQRGRKLRSLLYNDFQERMQEQRDNLNSSVAVAGLILFCLALFIATTIVFFNQRVSVPLAKVSRYAEDVAAGKEPHPLQLLHDDELSRMYVSMEKMKFALVQRIEAIDEARKAAQVSHDQAQQAKGEAVKAMEKAKIMARTQEDFLRRISHEIRTPLNAITGMSYLCMQTRLDQSQRDYLNKINVAGNNLLEMFNRMLDFSSVAEGHLRPEYAEFALKPFLERMREAFAPRAASKQLAFAMDMPEDLPQVVLSDEGHLEEVLRILLDNALKFTERGKIGLACALTPNGLLRFTVSDTGLGISDNVRESIFAPYQDGSRAGEEIHHGLGLGLALANSLVTFMGSALSIESKAGEGSSFSFELPYKREDIAIDKEAETKVERTTVDRAPIVLVVDDNEINLQIDAELLEQAGITPVLVENGQEAVDYAREHEVDLVLMDMQMPVMDGIEATKRLREMGFSREELPILAMTAHTDEGSRKDGQNAGMNDYLTKPIDPAMLYERIAHWLPNANIRIPGGPEESEALASEQQRMEDVSNIAGDLIDIKAGLATLTGNKKLYAELLEHFAERYASSGMELRSLLALSDNAGAARLVHTIKGTSANLGLTPLNALAIAMEAGLPATAPAEEILARFDETLRATVSVIGQLLRDAEGNDFVDGTEPLAVETAQELARLLADLPEQVERDWGTAEAALAAFGAKMQGTAHAVAFGRALKAVNAFDVPLIREECRSLAERLQTAAA